MALMLSEGISERSIVRESSARPSSSSSSMRSSSELIDSASALTLTSYIIFVTSCMLLMASRISITMNPLYMASFWSRIHKRRFARSSASLKETLTFILLFEPDCIGDWLCPSAPYCSSSFASRMRFFISRSSLYMRNPSLVIFMSCESDRPRYCWTCESIRL